MSLIRVGLSRCDTHGLWYGPLMAEHDPPGLSAPLSAGTAGPLLLDDWRPAHLLLHQLRQCPQPQRTLRRRL